MYFIYGTLLPYGNILILAKCTVMYLHYCNIMMVPYFIMVRYLHYHDIEQLVVNYIVKGLAVINKSDEGTFFGLNQFLYHDLKCTDQVCSSSTFSETILFFWRCLRNFLL